MRRLIRIIRNILLLAIAAIVILAGVLLSMSSLTGRGRFRSQRCRARRSTSRARGPALRGDPLPDHFEFPQSRTARRGAARLRAHIEAALAFHAVAKRELVGGHSLPTPGRAAIPRRRPIALLAIRTWCRGAGHREGLQHPPFDGVHADGSSGARVVDDKGNLYSMLEAAEQMGSRDSARSEPSIRVRPRRGGRRAQGRQSHRATLARRHKARLRARRRPPDHEGIMKGSTSLPRLIGVAEKGYATLC